jgi:hypothetical protein
MLLPRFAPGTGGPELIATCDELPPKEALPEASTPANIPRSPVDEDGVKVSDLLSRRFKRPSRSRPSLPPKILELITDCDEFEPFKSWACGVEVAICDLKSR